MYKLKGEPKSRGSFFFEQKRSSLRLNNLHIAAIYDHYLNCFCNKKVRPLNSKAD